MISILAALCNFFLLSAAITVNNSGYEGIVVAIHKSIPQDNNIIKEIQDMFRDGSPFLYEAVDKRAYFRTVTILVPSTWTADPTWGSDESLNFKDADIRVDQPHPDHGTDPYVFQPGQCGEQGRYIHFTSKYLLNSDGYRDFNYGNAGRILVHEFAHYRYGVFDEYGFQDSRNHPLWYLDGKEARPTGCTRKIKGFAINVEKDERCSSETSVGLPSDKCIFIPLWRNNSIKASIMAYYTVPSVTKFCKSDTDSLDEEHNVLANNQHNKMCSKKGVYDVIMNHEDFRLGNPPVEGIDVTPTFTIVQKVTADGQKCGRRTVLVLDLSGSMKSNQKYFKLGQAGDRLIRDILPTGTDFGIVTFTSSAKVWTEMTMITNHTVRNDLASTLPVQAHFGGGTTISSGLSLALELLRRNGKQTKDAHIVLVTDGQTSEDLLAVSLPTLIAAGVKVHSIGLGPDAERTISSLSSKTGGSFSYYSEASTSTDLDSAMERLLEFLSTCEKIGGIEIERLGFLINKAASPYTGTIQVDETVGENTLFSFAFPRRISVQVTVTDPDGKRYDSASQEYEYTSSRNIVRFRFPFTVNGYWKYTLQTNVSSLQPVVLVAKSNVRENVTAPIEAETRLSNTELDLSTSSAAPVVYTYVHQGYAPITGAKVTVTVDRSPDPKVVIFPKDDGLLPDNREGDGVYTAYVTQIAGSQRISMQVRAEAIAGQTAARGTGSSGAVSIYQNTTGTPVLVGIGNFTRTSSPGAVDVSGFTSGADFFPPGTVTDLSVVTFDRAAHTVTLNWTSPGDDYTEGTVDRYELRMAGESRSLMLNFNNSRPVTEMEVKEGNFTPVRAGSPHTIVVSVPSDWPHDSYIFGLKAFDEVNRSSDLSNLPSVTFQEVILPEGPQTTPTPTTAPKQEIPVFIIIAAVVGGAIILMIVIVIIVVLSRRGKAEPYSAEAPEPEKTEPSSTAITEPSAPVETEPSKSNTAFRM